MQHVGCLSLISIDEAHYCSPWDDEFLCLGQQGSGIMIGISMFTILVLHHEEFVNLGFSDVILGPSGHVLVKVGFNLLKLGLNVLRFTLGGHN